MNLSAATSHLSNATEFYIDTPMSARFCNRIKQWVWCGFRGGVCVGESRAGKSTAALRLRTGLESRSQQHIPVHYVTFAERDKKTIREVHAKTARALGFDVKPHHRSDHLLNHIITKLGESALSNDARQVIVLIDEAQLLTMTQLNAFCEVYNELTIIRTNVCFYFIANSDLFSPLLELILGKDMTYLRQRHFNHNYVFEGIESCEDLKHCLAEYDRTHSTSAGEEFIPTEIFLPQAFASGWRLEQIAGKLWQAFDEGYKRPLKLKDWGMEYFTQAVNVLLMDYLPRYDLEDDELLQSMIDQSLAASDLIPSLSRLLKK